LDDVEYAKHAYEQAIRLNIQNITTDPVNLILNYAVSLFNHKKFSDSHQKLVEVYNMIENGSGVVIEEDVIITFTLKENNNALRELTFK